MRKTIYLAVCERLKEQTPDIRHISLWNENITNLEQENGYCFPAVFVEFEPIRWKQGGNHCKTATARIHLHICTQTLADPSDGSPYQLDALETFDIINSVVFAVSGLAGNGFNSLQHVETVPDHNHAEIQHDIEVFSCEISDFSGASRKKYTRADKLKITPKIEH
jgi:hypothetical protein